jgi:hypothetical protein
MPAAAVITRPRYCRVTFALKDSIVEKITFAGYTAGPLVESRECAGVTGKCLEK